MNRQTGDFGQTLFVWGIEPGPFVVLPVLGPATFRDGIGRAVDPSMNPATYAITIGAAWHWVGVGGFSALSGAAGLDDVLWARSTSIRGFAASICKSARRNSARLSASPSRRRRKWSTRRRRRLKAEAARRENRAEGDEDAVAEGYPPSSCAVFSRSALTSASGPPEAMIRKTRRAGKRLR